MKTILLFFVLAFNFYGQQRGGHATPAPSASQNTPPTQMRPQFEPQRPSVPSVPIRQPDMDRRPERRPEPPQMPGRGPRPQPPVVVIRPEYNNSRPVYGSYGWNYYFDMGFWPYYYPHHYDYGVYLSQKPQPCKKEKLKDSNGKKHEILVCIQPDGSYKVVADANLLVPVPKSEVK